MVSWSDLADAIQKNAHVTFCVPHITLHADRCSVPVIAGPSNVVITESARPSSGDEGGGSVAAIVAPPEPKNPMNPIKEGETSSIPRASKINIDPVVLGIEHVDPLYASAPRLTKHQMEITEAQRIEGMLSDVYTKESGRSRGWTKGGLEQMLKPRCASGGDVRELDRARVAFPWKLVRDDKQASAFLDFLCVCKRIRVAVWDTDAKIVVLYPAADTAAAATAPPPPLYHVSIAGDLMYGAQDLVKTCDSNKFVLMPPLSVLKSLSGLTMDELASVATQLSMSGGVTGNKAERVAAIAAFKVRSRLSVPARPL
jgi:hypothetical protein